MRETIGFINTPTLRTSPAGITRVNEEHPHSYSFGLVSDVLAQLIERPVTMLASLLATYNRSLADARQIFQGDGSASVYCFFNKMFADLVVGVLLEACLLSRQFLEFTFGGSGLLLLQILSAMLELPAIVLDRLTAKILPVAVGGQIDDAQVYSQHAFKIDWLRSFLLTRGEQVELAFDVAQVTFPALALQQFKLSPAGREGDPHPTVYRPEADFLPFQMVGQDATIKGNRSLWLERAPDFPVDLIGIRNLREAPDDDLGAQREHLPRVSIRQLVQLELTERIVFPRLRANVIAGSIRHFECFAKRVRLIGRRQEFQLGDQLHRTSVLHFTIEKEQG